MPSESSSQSGATEKPHHYTYLKEFRTQQCPLFLQHKCTQHRPFTCFHWHFMNQRRRRPVRKREGTFNYSPDVYCTKYDETTGICPEGDECPFLHRTAGDTERRYHLRYYKTSVCVHETDSKGFCVKNGPHCAFAHGAQDLRPPVYDIRELSPPDGVIDVDTPLASSVEKDRLINEDPRWNDTNYVLTNYKTEQCKRPPRLCRQGYACPSYHNTRDRRRSPKKFKYRSTPCPNVKHGDDWGDPSQCDSGESCQYCHTRTEQQFHPEIYKSTKCNDMVQTGYCPRGPFCAFAHVEQEMTTHRDIPAPTDTSLAAFVTSVLPDTGSHRNHHRNGTGADHEEGDKLFGNNNHKAHINQMNYNVLPPSTAGLARTLSLDTGDARLGLSGGTSMPQPIGKGRSFSVANSTGLESFYPGSYGRAPGSEREDLVNQITFRKNLQLIDSNPNLDAAEKQRCKQNLMIMHSLQSNGSQLSPSSAPSSVPTNLGAGGVLPMSTMSPNAPSFYPPRDTVESVIGTALDEDLNLGELSLASIDRELGRDDNDTNSVCSSISAGLSSAGLAGSYIGASSVPVTIPSAGPAEYRSSLSSLSQSMSPTASPSDHHLHNNFLSSLHHKHDHGLDAMALAFLSQPNPGKYAAPGFAENSFSSMSPSSISQSPQLAGGHPGLAQNGVGDIQRLREELLTQKMKLAQWEDGITQARSACEAWKKEADEANRRSKAAEEDRIKLLKQRDEALKQSTKLKVELDQVRGGSHAHLPQRPGELDSLSVARLQQMQSQLRIDLETLDKVLFQRTNLQQQQKQQQQQNGITCNGCQEKRQSLAVLPCSHYVICDACVAKKIECSACKPKVPAKHRAGSGSTVPM